jgi:hypothetical protein
MKPAMKVQELKDEELAEVSGAGWFSNNWLFGYSDACYADVQQAGGRAFDQSIRYFGIPGAADNAQRQAEALTWATDPECQ